MKNCRHKGAIRKFGHIPISMVSLLKISPSPENERLYKPVNADDPDLIALAKSIEEFGLREPLVITKDNYIVSGHRRARAAWSAGLRKVPCRRLNITREGHPDFVRLLAEFNRQRVKTREEQLREEVLSVNPEEAYEDLNEYREKSSRITVETIELREEKLRSEISDAKKPFLSAVQRIIQRLRDFWPLSNRQIHYQLLNDPPLIHASKPNTIYRNNLASYKALSDLLTRARHSGRIKYDVIADETRPVTVWNVNKNTADYFREKLPDLFKDYWRDQQQSQPNHIEIVGEKLTIATIISSVAARYCLPMTIGRGYCSTKPKHDIAQRYRASGKQRLVLLVISDFDPDGDEICHSLGRSLRDDFRIANIDAIKVALKAEQVAELKLPPSMVTAKSTSANYRRFVERYGSEEVYELEALPPETLQELLDEAIGSILDVDAFNAEIASEKLDAAHIEAVRRRVLTVLQEAGGVE